MDSKDMMNLTKVIEAMKEYRPSDKPDDHLHTVAVLCRIIAGGMSPVSESGRVTIQSTADLLDYIAGQEGADTTDSPGIDNLTRTGVPIQPDTSG